MGKKKIKQEVEPVEVLSRKQYEAIEKIENKRDKAIIELFLLTGLRCAEMQNLKLKNVMYYGKVRDSFQVLGKGEKIRRIPVSKKARKAIQTLLAYNVEKWNRSEEDDNLIRTEKGRMSERNIHKIVKKHTGKGPHVLRHSFATVMLEMGVRIDIIAEILGHDDIKVTYRHYISRTTEQKIDSVEKLEEVWK